MIYRHNSTIGVKTKPCRSCGRDSIIFSRGRCQNCAKVEDTHSKISSQKDQEDDLSDLENRLWDLVSKWVRYGSINEYGMVNCYTCSAYIKPADADAGHYITRACKYLKFDLRNIKPQCKTCNQSKSGMAAAFGKHLEEDHFGITEILLEESHIVHSWSRDELRGLITEFSNKIKKLK